MLTRIRGLFVDLFELVAKNSLSALKSWDYLPKFVNFLRNIENQCAIFDVWVIAVSTNSYRSVDEK